MAVPSTPTPSPPYSIGALEGGAVAFLGAFAGSFALAGGSIEGSLFAGLGAFAAYLGYHAYQSS
jgi:hypothetical protein